MKARIGGAIRSVIGDKLPQRFSPPMAFVPPPGRLKGHVCIFVHGSADTETGWSVKPPRLSFGDSLQSDFKVAVLYVRYNSGLAIDESGKALAALVAELVSRNKGIGKITFFGHSMGGLVIHAALAVPAPWRKKVVQVFLLGTPHKGAPLAKFAAGTQQILQFIPNPFTKIVASVINLRSRGLKDLSQGGAERLLVKGVRYVFVAGGLQKKPRGIFNRLVGDGMVRQPSAVPAGEDMQPGVVFETVGGVGHLALRNSPAVYALLARHFRA